MLEYQQQQQQQQQQAKSSDSIQDVKLWNFNKKYFLIIEMQIKISKKSANQKKSRRSFGEILNSIQKL